LVWYFTQGDWKASPTVFKSLFRVDLEDMCKKEDMSPAKNMAIEDVIDEEGGRVPDRCG
jgi:hypothetical protein